MNLERWRLFVPIMLGGLGFVFVSDWIARGCGAALILLALGLLWYWSANPVLPDLVFTGAAKVLDDLPAFETFSVANNRGSAIYDVSIQPFEISGTLLKFSKLTRLGVHETAVISSIRDVEIDMFHGFLLQSRRHTTQTVIDVSLSFRFKPKGRPRQRKYRLVCSTTGALKLSPL